MTSEQVKRHFYFDSITKLKRMGFSKEKYLNMLNETRKIYYPDGAYPE